MNSTLKTFLPTTTAIVAVLGCLLLVAPAAVGQVFTTNVIVEGSLCVGVDCVSGESFGFDTIRLKENNLRIKFQDTSTSSGFPSNDWQIIANDSASGGANYLAIEDSNAGRIPFRVEAGARSNALVVESDGDVGIGTLNPAVDIHVKNGNTPTLRLEQDATSGFTAQTWDVAGNETNFFVRDATNGSTLPFRIKPSAPSNSIFINNNGDVGLGTASPSEAFHVNRASGAGSVRLLTKSTDNGPVQWLMQTDSSNRRFLAQNGSGTNQAQIVFGDNGAFQFLGPTSSDVRLNIDSSGNVTIQGNCTDGNGAGGGTDGCDYVFDPAYHLESIEDHAAFMWQNSHLPAIGPTPEGKTVSLSLQQRHFGMLNELEKAHIYIERLNEKLKEKGSEVDELAARVAHLEALVAGK